jgi:fructose-1,6-bisphosphatase I
VAAGYVLYSHPPTLVLALGGEGGGSHVFSLDRSSGDFVLARPDLRVPQRGQRCTVLESDRQLWPAALRQYVDVVGRAEGESKAPYAVTTSRSLLADFHATLK